MMKPIKLIPVLAILLTGLAGGARGASVRKMTLDELLVRSDCVVYGIVMSSHSYLDAPSGNIWTQTEIKVLDGPKGKPGNSVVIVEPGGVVGDIGHVFPGVPRFNLQQEVVVFLYSAGTNRYRVTGLRQGIYSVAADKSAGTRVVQPDLQGREVVFIDGNQPVSARQAFPADEFRLDQFLQKIRNASAK